MTEQPDTCIPVFDKVDGLRYVVLLSVCLFFCSLSVCLSVCLLAFLSVCLSVCLLAFLFSVCLSVCLLACLLSVCFSVCLFAVCLSVFLFVGMSVRCVCLSLLMSSCLTHFVTAYLCVHMSHLSFHPSVIFWKVTVIFIFSFSSPGFCFVSWT